MMNIRPALPIFIKARNTSVIIILLAVFINCKESDKNINPVLQPDPEDVPDIAPVICDFEMNETVLTTAGWVKTFEDNFNSDLSKWNVWTGGAFNNELQYYQASNIELEKGILLIHAKKETVTGNATPFDQTQKTFQFTSGRIECKTNVSAGSSSSKVRIVARIKLPAGSGLWPAFWTYGDPWPTQGEIDIIEARGQERKNIRPIISMERQPITTWFRVQKVLSKRTKI